MASNVVNDQKKSVSQELLKFSDPAKRKEAVVYSLLQENKIKKGTFKVESSKTLDLVKQFIPRLKEENAKLHSDISRFPVNKSKYDIEHLEDGPVIEMDIACYEDEDSGSGSDNPSSEDESENINAPTGTNNLTSNLLTEKKNLVEEINE